MNAQNIVVLGLKGTVTAYRKDNGQRLWSNQLKSSMGGGFVSVTADETRVFAHAGGELFCLDLFSGLCLWNDGLRGMGYGVASIAIPGVPGLAPAAAFEKKRQDDTAASTSHSATSA